MQANAGRRKKPGIFVYLPALPCGWSAWCEAGVQKTRQELGFRMDVGQHDSWTNLEKVWGDHWESSFRFSHPEGSTEVFGIIVHGWHPVGKRARNEHVSPLYSGGNKSKASMQRDVLG